MKKIALVLMVVFWVGSALAFQPSEWMHQTATLTADAAAASGEGYLYGIVIVTDGTNAPTVAVYDNSSAEGTKLVPDLSLAATPRVQTLSLEPSVPFNTGVYVDVTVGGGGTIAYMVYYRLK